MWQPSHVVRICVARPLVGFCLGSCLTGAARGNRTANRVSVSSGKNDLKRLAGSGFRGFNILEDVSYRNAPRGAGADARSDHCAGTRVQRIEYGCYATLVGGHGQAAWVGI